MSAQDLEDYRRHNDPQTAADARDQRAMSQIHGNEAAGAWGGSSDGNQRDGK